MRIDPPPIDQDDSLRRLSGQRWWIWLSVSLGVFMATLDSSVVNVSLPTIALELQSDLPATQWVVLAYMVVIAALLIPMGRLADIWGWRNVYVAGMVMFTLGSWLCGTSQSVMTLIWMRGVQAVGAAGVMSLGPAIVTETFKTDRGKALGFLGTVVSLGTISGPSIGGWIVEAMGWPWIFWINVPVGLLAAVYSWWMLGACHSPNPDKPSFDLLGALYSIWGLFSLTLLLTYGPTLSTLDPVNLFLLGGSVVGLGLFIRHERRVADPLLPFSLFRIREFTNTAVASYLAFFGITMIFFLMPFYLEVVRHLGPALTGWVLITSAAGLALTSPISGTLSDRAGALILRVLGMTISTGGLFWIATFDNTTPLLWVILGLLTVGMGNGLFHSPNNSQLLGSVPRAYLGVVGAVMAIVRTLGMATAVALVGLIYHLYGAHLVEPDRFLSAYRAVFVAGALLTLINVIWIVGYRSKLAS